MEPTTQTQSQRHIETLKARYTPDVYEMYVKMLEKMDREKKDRCEKSC